MIPWLAVTALAAEVPAEVPTEAPAEVPADLPADLPIAPWWRAFDDPVVEGLVLKGLGANPDLRGAWARVEQARALGRMELSGLLPQAAFTVSTQSSPTESLGFQFGGLPVDPTAPDVYHTGSAMLGVTLTPDVFGRQALSWRASRMDARATEGDAVAVALALSTRIVGTWYDLVATRGRIAAFEEQLEARNELLELARLRFERGIGSGLEVLQQQQQRDALAASLPVLQAQGDTLEQMLAVLVGVDPMDLDALPAPAEPRLPALPPLALPETSERLVAERPEVRAAEARLGAAERRSQSAVRGLLPSFGLSGQVGWQGRWFDELDTQEVWTVGTSTTVPLFLGGASWAGVRQARAAEVGARASYETTLRQALADVEGARVLEERRQEALRATLSQLETARLAYAEAREQYVRGLLSYLEVLLALEALLQAETGAIQAHRDLLGARIQLVDALGGATP